MDRRGGAGEIENLVHLDEQRMGHVVAHSLEMRVRQQMRDIVLAPGEVIIDAQYVMAARQEPLAQMRAEKAGAAGNEDALGNRLHRVILCFWLPGPAQLIARSPAGFFVGVARLGRPMLW